MSEQRIRVAPEVCSYVDDDHTSLTLEISIPGVSKKDINLRMHQDSFSLSARRDETEYVTTLSFCCPVKPDEAEATYKDGLLKIEVPFKDLMEDAVQISVH